MKYGKNGVYYKMLTDFEIVFIFLCKNVYIRSITKLAWMIYLLNICEYKEILYLKLIIKIE